MNTYELRRGADPHQQDRRSAIDQADLIYKSEAAKFDAVVDDIAEQSRDGPADPGRHDQRREERVPRRSC